LAAHTYICRTVAKLDDAEITANRSGASNDLTADAAVRFAVKVVNARGHVSDADVTAVKVASTMRRSSRSSCTSRSTR
jgi:hypothetical protein